ncbi:MAG: cytochrome c peroxidase [Sulfurovum sp.]|uniref:cytochrome c peroxidase n=1 Tax=Sulfurovum sp. TaxID=1969726 RepID=UPI003C75E5FD
MKIKYLRSFLIGSTLLLTQTHADMTEQILSEIASGERSIRPEIQSLKTVPIPEPADLDVYVKNKQNAIALGKALFWDMQLGSDGATACASCHFNAGADSRAKNQINPGFAHANQDGTSNSSNVFDEDQGPNYHLSVSDFPRHVKSDPNLFISNVLRDTDDVLGSQGVHYSLFTEAGEGDLLADPDGFEVAGTNTRRVQARNSPTVINAVFNHRQFWDGRASNIFNGKNTHGDADVDALVYKVIDGKATGINISIDNASLASQATDPITSNIEMSADGRTWSDVGVEILFNDTDSGQGRNQGIGEVTREILAAKPLANQKVSPTDSVLGELVDSNGTGLNVTSYDAMIRAAFQPEWWSSNETITLEDNTTHTQMELNFSLYFGLAVQLYEATLVSDNTRVDQYLEGDTSALTEQEIVGFHLADAEGRCLNCHGGSELTFASVSRINEQGLTRNRKGDLIDEGFNNIGVRPTLDDLGVGGIDPFGNALGYARQTQLGLYDNPNIDDTEEMTADLGNDGAFKIPPLRNIALTAPYFHNGGESTLEDVIDFYFRGGNFREFDEGLSHPIIGYSADRMEESPITGLGILTGELLDSGPGLDDADKASLVAFLKALTDERVLYRKAPFDHPQLFVPAGHVGDNTAVEMDENGQAKDILIEIPAVGAEGGDPLPTFYKNLAPATDTAMVDEDPSITENVSTSGGGGGCTYDPNSKHFDMSFLFILALGLLYPFRRRIQS